MRRRRLSLTGVSVEFAAQVVAHKKRREYGDRVDSADGELRE